MLLTTCWLLAVILLYIAVNINMQIYFINDLLYAKTELKEIDHAILTHSPFRIGQ